MYMEKQKIECELKYWSDEVKAYTCFIKSKIIKEGAVLEFIGKHIEEKTNQDVTAIDFRNCTISKVPQGLTKLFPNMNFLQIHNSKLQSVEQNDLDEYKNLNTVCLEMNEIKYLPGDLFTGWKNLKAITFQNNKIEAIEPNLLDGLEKLTKVNLKGNVYIDKCFDSVGNDGNATLQEIKDEIREKFSWKKIFDERNQFEKEIVELKSAFQAATNKNQELDTRNDGICSDLKTIIQNENLKDFIIQVDDEECKVHKLILAARSPVLKEMIENNIDAECLKLTDIPKKIFREILNFMYTDKLPESDEINYLHLFIAAGRLKIKNLMNFAANKLANEVNAENAMEILTLANKYENENLRQKSFEIIKNELDGEIAEITDDFATRPDKLKKILGIQKKRDEMMKKMELELKIALDED